jgi:hypothetical protein
MTILTLIAYRHRSRRPEFLSFPVSLEIEPRLTETGHNVVSQHRSTSFKSRQPSSYPGLFEICPKFPLMNTTDSRASVWHNYITLRPYLGNSRRSHKNLGPLRIRQRRDTRRK